MGAGMFLIGIVFKLSLVPFHTWTPDVFEGAPLPVTAFMSVATKAGVLAVFARFIYAALPSGVAERLLLPVWVVAGISMIVGNVGMLAQHDLKRLLGYSGIAQVGYILAALAGVTPLGLRYAIYYLDGVCVHEPWGVRGRRRDLGRGRRGRALKRLPWLGAATAVAGGGDDGVPACLSRLAADRRLSRKDLDSRDERRPPATSGWRRS